MSKVFDLIKRFSEDIDISLSPDWLGFGGENRPDMAPSRSQFEKRCKKLEKACLDAIKNTVGPALEASIGEVLGEPSSGETYLEYQEDPVTHSPVLVFRYPTAEIDPGGYIRPQVKLEFGSLTDQRPVGTHPVTPWIAEEFPESFREPCCDVVALEAKRTFWEKATILHAEYHRPKESPMREHLSRDCYDVSCISEKPAGESALRDLELLARVVEHKRKYFRSSWANHESAKPGSLRLVPPDYRIDELKDDYRRMQEMFLEEPPTFNVLLGRLAKLEERINA